MKSGSKWSREELLLVMNLYFRILFGRQHSRAPEVVELATMLGRTSGSVAMKLNNITSLDPEENLRGVRGLSGASSLDHAIWTEFQNDWEQVTAESEALWNERIQKIAAAEQNMSQYNNAPLDEYGHEWDKSRPTEKTQPAKVRLAQSYFRKVVLSAYGGRCCITGIPIPELLIASHILPWNSHPEHRSDPRNGLCLSRLHDAAFDQGLITFDEENRLVLSAKIKEHLTSAVMNYSFALYEGKTITMPERFAPNSNFMTIHRETNFAG
jgi:putative restriction endonuclease